MVQVEVNDINEEIEEVGEDAVPWDGEEFAREWIRSQMVRRALSVEPK